MYIIIIYMKHRIAVLALLGLLTADHVTALQHSAVTADWDDLIDSKVFNEQPYSSDNPDGYTHAVDEVFEEKEVRAQKKAEAEAKHEAELKQKAEAEQKKKIETQQKAEAEKKAKEAAAAK